MKKISLQWRITLMTAILLCVTCVVMNCLIIYSGKHYMDVIGSGISAYSSNDASRESSAGKLDEKGESSAGADSSGESFNPENVDLNHAGILWPHGLVHYGLHDAAGRRAGIFRHRPCAETAAHLHFSD